MIHEPVEAEGVTAMNSRRRAGDRGIARRRPQPLADAIEESQAHDPRPGKGKPDQRSGQV